MQNNCYLSIHRVATTILEKTNYDLEYSFVMEYSKHFCISERKFTFLCFMYLFIHLFIFVIQANLSEHS